MRGVNIAEVLNIGTSGILSCSKYVVVRMALLIRPRHTNFGHFGGIHRDAGGMKSRLMRTSITVTIRAFQIGEPLELVRPRDLRSLHGCDALQYGSKPLPPSTT